MGDLEIMAVLLLLLAVALLSSLARIKIVFDNKPRFLSRGRLGQFELDSNDEVLAELRRRFPTCLFVGVRAIGCEGEALTQPDGVCVCRIESAGETREQIDDSARHLIRVASQVVVHGHSAATERMP